MTMAANILGRFELVMGEILITEQNRWLNEFS